MNQVDLVAFLILFLGIVILAYPLFLLVLERATERKSSDNEPFAALGFKIMTDPFVGQLVFFRVYSGVLAAGDTVYNPVKDKKERIGRILQMHANSREDIKEANTGDIVALAGLKYTITGHTLADEDKP